MRPIAASDAAYAKFDLGTPADDLIGGAPAFGDAVAIRGNAATDYDDPIAYQP